MKNPGKGLLLIGLGVVVFVIASICQGLVQSSMFSTQYVDSGTVLNLLATVTFWPGWILTVGFIIMGVKALFTGEKSEG